VVNIVCCAFQRSLLDRSNWRDSRSALGASITVVAVLLFRKPSFDCDAFRRGGEEGRIAIEMRCGRIGNYNGTSEVNPPSSAAPANSDSTLSCGEQQMHLPADRWACGRRDPFWRPRDRLARRGWPVRPQCGSSVAVASVSDGDTRSCTPKALGTSRSWIGSGRGAGGDARSLRRAWSGRQDTDEESSTNSFVAARFRAERGPARRCLLAVPMCLRSAADAITLDRGGWERLAGSSQARQLRPPIVATC